MPASPSRPNHHPESRTDLFERMFRACRARPRAVKLADSTGAKLTGVETLVRALVLRSILRREVLSEDERTVAVLLPPTVAAAVANVALALDRRVTVNLNYTLSEAMLDDCVARAGVRHVLTSRAFMARMPIALRNAELVFLEDLAPKATRADKARALALGAAAPIPVALKALGLDAARSGDLFTIVFTSGSTGTPKGVMLSVGNIASNLEGVDHVVRWNDRDTVVGVLPFFHSFGSTVTLWAVMTRNVGVIYHTNPLEGQVVGRLTREWGGTILAATPMFLRNYLRRCPKEDFASLAVVAVGAERLPDSLADEVAATWGIDPIQGYGSTEMAPLVSANVPVNRARVRPEEWNRRGTVGRPVPGTLARVVDPETFEDLPTGEPGMLLVTGPNLMLGYLDDPAATAAAVRDGWYMTGDIASLDHDGFIRLRDRQSRFAKIAGESVPFAAVEEPLQAALGPDETGLPRAVVTAIPDERRGERLVVVHTKVDRTPEEMLGLLREAKLPNLFLPDRDSFVEVETMPTIGAGKLDLKGVRQSALERLAGAGTATSR